MRAEITTSSTWQTGRVRAERAVVTLVTAILTGGRQYAFHTLRSQSHAVVPDAERCDCGFEPRHCIAASVSFFMGSLMFRKLHDVQKQAITIYLDGIPVAAEENESVAAVLLRQEQIWSRTTPVSGVLRAPYCMMGVCFDCLAMVDGVSSIQTCLTPVRDGMRIERQLGRPELLS